MLLIMHKAWNGAHAKPYMMVLRACRHPYATNTNILSSGGVDANLAVHLLNIASINTIPTFK